MAALVYTMENGLPGIDCQGCGQAASVSVRGRRVNVRCYADCPAEIALGCLDQEQIAAEAKKIAEDQAAREDQAAPSPQPLPNGAVGGLLYEARFLIERYVVLPSEEVAIALALFVAHTWAIDGAHATPYILVISPEKRSGKSRLLQTTDRLVRSPWTVISASEAAMFRKIAKDRPTLLLDEIDAIFGSHTERTEPLRAVINAGNRPGSTVARCVGDDQDVRDFEVFCAKMLAGIDSGHRIPDTIRDRSIPIRMVRKTDGEIVERFRYRDVDAEAEPIRQGLEAWALGAIDALLAADPTVPRELNDRAAEAWEPLLAIADMAGGDWPQLARKAAVSLSADDDRDEVTTGTLLLAAIKDAFDAERLPTTTLLDRINGDDNLPFGGWREGKGLDGRALARLLKPYGIRPRTIRIDDRTEKGYQRDWFTEAWARWLATPTPTPIEASHRSHPSQPNGTVTDEPHQKANVTAVTDVTAVSDTGVGDGNRPSRNGNGTEISSHTASPAEEAEAERIAAKFEEVRP